MSRGFPPGSGRRRRVGRIGHLSPSVSAARRRELDPARRAGLRWRTPRGIGYAVAGERRGRSVERTDAIIRGTEAAGSVRARRRRRAALGGAVLRHRRHHLPHRPRPGDAVCRTPPARLLAALVAAPGTRRLRHRPRPRGRPAHDPAGRRRLRGHARPRGDGGRTEASRPSRRPSATSPQVQEVAEAAARDLDCEALGIVLENKRTVLAVHYRLASDAARTRHEILTRVVEPARARGLAISTGHFVFEVRPPLPVHQGHGDAPPAGRRRLPRGAVLRRRPHRRHRLRGGARVGRRDARRAPAPRRGHRRDAAAGHRRGRRAGARHARRARGAGAAGRGRRRADRAGPGGRGPPGPALSAR